MVIYILVKFSPDWLKVVNAREKTKSNIAFFLNSRANNSGRSGPIRPIIELIQDFMVIYVFGVIYIFGPSLVLIG